MSVICTISTYHHLYKTYALADSLARFEHRLILLLVDGKGQQTLDHKNISFLRLEDLTVNGSKDIVDKYSRNQDKLRWALKSILLLQLSESYNQVIYVDNDIFFFNTPQFLFDELTKSNILLTPHFYPSSPKENQTWLEANFRIGLYNAGFIGINKNAKTALEWWRDCCLYELKKSYWRGLFDDQKFLDLLPILFDNVKIIKHRGCNLAGWNDYIELGDNEVIFIHFNNYTIKKFANNSHKFRHFLECYKKAILKYNSSGVIAKNVITILDLQNIVYFLRWKLSRFL